VPIKGEDATQRTNRGPAASLLVNEAKEEGKRTKQQAKRNLGHAQQKQFGGEFKNN